jgi:spore maturation protein CgeB
MFEQTFRALQALFPAVDRLNYMEHFKKNGLMGLEGDIKRLIEESHIDTLLIFRHADSFVLTPEFLQELKTLHVRIIFMFFDDEMYLHSLSKYYAQVADGVITTDYYGSFYYEQIGIPCEVYFSGYSKEIYYPKEVKKDIDVSFVGNLLKQDRKAYVDYLENQGIYVETFGVGAKNYFLEESEFADIFSRTKINLNFTKTEMTLSYVTQEDPLSLKTRQNKGRPIEIALCGGFCLSEYAPTLGKVFEIGEQIDQFETKEELYAKVRYYLDHPDIAEAMAQKAYQKALEDYEISHYLNGVFQALEHKIEHRSFDVYPLLYNKHFLWLKSQAFFRYSIRALGFGVQEFFYCLKRGLYPYRFVNIFGYLSGVVKIPYDIYNRYLVYKAIKSKNKPSHG